MKVVRVIGYGVGFAFILLCATLTAVNRPGEERDSDDGRVATATSEQDARPTRATPDGRMARGFGFGMSFDPEERFRSRDTDGDGRLSREEATAPWGSFSGSGGVDEQRRREWVERWFGDADEDKDGFVSLEESKASWAKMREAGQKAREEFAAMDGDHDGRLTVEEMSGSGGGGEEREGIEERFKRWDRDGDGFVTEREVWVGRFAENREGAK